MPPHTAVFAGSSVYRRLSGFDLHYRIAASISLLLRFFARGTARVGFIPQVLVKMRVGGVSNRNLKTVLRKSREDWPSLRRKGLVGF